LLAHLYGKYFRFNMFLPYPTIMYLKSIPTQGRVIAFKWVKIGYMPKKRILGPQDTNISYQCIWDVHLPCLKASLHYYYYYYYYSLSYLVCIAGNKYKWVFQKWNSHSCKCTFVATFAFGKGKIMQPPTTLQDFDIMFMRLPYP
jgi:hypothetical protein